MRFWEKPSFVKVEDLYVYQMQTSKPYTFLGALPAYPLVSDFLQFKLLIVSQAFLLHDSVHRLIIPAQFLQL